MNISLKSLAKALGTVVGLLLLADLLALTTYGNAIAVLGCVTFAFYIIYEGK